LSKVPQGSAAGIKAFSRQIPAATGGKSSASTYLNHLAGFTALPELLVTDALCSLTSSFPAFFHTGFLAHRRYQDDSEATVTVGTGRSHQEHDTAPPRSRRCSVPLRMAHCNSTWRATAGHPPGLEHSCSKSPSQGNPDTSGSYCLPSQPSQRQK